MKTKMSETIKIDKYQGWIDWAKVKSLCHKIITSA